MCFFQIIKLWASCVWMGLPSLSPWALHSAICWLKLWRTKRPLEGGTTVGFRTRCSCVLHLAGWTVQVSHCQIESSFQSASIRFLIIFVFMYIELCKMFWPVACFVILRPLLPRQQFLFQVQASEFYVKTFKKLHSDSKTLCVDARSAFEVWVPVKRTSECSNLKDRRWHRLNVKQTSLTQKGISLAFSCFFLPSLMWVSSQTSMHSHDNVPCIDCRLTGYGDIVPLL